MKEGWAWDSDPSTAIRAFCLIKLTNEGERYQYRVVQDDRNNEMFQYFSETDPNAEILTVGEPAYFWSFENPACAIYATLAEVKAGGYCVETGGHYKYCSHTPPELK